MRPGFGQFNVATPEYLRFAAQFGATDVLLNTPLLPGAERWELVDLVKLRLSVEQWGLKLSAIENVPPYFYDQIMLGGPRRDEQIDNMIHTVRNIARAGIPIFGYNWMPSHVWRTPPRAIRGGALATAYDDRLGQQYPPTHGRVYTEDELWSNLEYWIKIITPIAEAEGIRLGIHPCDPPVPVLGGVPQILRSFAAYKRLIEIYPSDCNAIEFCQGTMAEMADEVDMHKAMEIYYDVGFDGFFIDDHVPQTFQDTTWGHRGRAFANGYIQALIEAVTKQRQAEGIAPGTIKDWTPELVPA